MVTNFFNKCKALTFENDLHLQISLSSKQFVCSNSFPPSPLNLNVKCTQRIRTILFTRLKIHTNSYFTNFSSRMLVLEKEKKKMYAYHRIDLFRNKAPYEKIFTSTISMWTFPYRFTPFAYTASPPKKHGKQNIIKLPVHWQNLSFYSSLFLIFFFKYPRFWQSPIHIYSQQFLRKTSLSRKTASISRSIKTR